MDLPVDVFIDLIHALCDLGIVASDPHILV